MMTRSKAKGEQRCGAWKLLWSLKNISGSPSMYVKLDRTGPYQPLRLKLLTRPLSQEDRVIASLLPLCCASGTSHCEPARAHWEPFILVLSRLGGLMDASLVDFQRYLSGAGLINCGARCGAQALHSSGISLDPFDCGSPCRGGVCGKIVSYPLLPMLIGGFPHSPDV